MAVPNSVKLKPNFLSVIPDLVYGAVNQLFCGLVIVKR